MKEKPKSFNNKTSLIIKLAYDVSFLIHVYVNNNNNNNKNVYIYIYIPKTAQIIDI